MEGPDVVAELRNGRDPSLFHLYILGNQLHELLSVEVGQRDPLGGSFEPESIALRTEQPDLAHDVLIGFEPLEALESIVEGRAEGVESETFEGFDDGVVPSLYAVPLDRRDVVAVVFSEGEDVGRHFWQTQNVCTQILLDLTDLSGWGLTRKVDSDDFPSVFLG